MLLNNNCKYPGKAKFVTELSGGCLGIPENIRGVYGLEFCSLSMNNGVEEKRSFEWTWKNPSNISNAEMDDSPYVYRTAEELKTASFRGRSSQKYIFTLIVKLVLNLFTFCRSRVVRFVNPKSPEFEPRADEV